MAAEAANEVEAEAATWLDSFFFHAYYLSRVHRAHNLSNLKLNCLLRHLLFETCKNSRKDGKFERQTGKGAQY